MPYEANSLEKLASHDFDTIIDVRTPAEFAEDKIPGAINLPVLSNEERARVGTIYTQESPFLARKIGAALVARNAAAHIEGPLTDKDGSWKPLIYCWRGGQRSGAFASILSQIGWRVETLVGGYQCYRRLIVAALYETEFPSPIILLDGNTGTGKTDVIQRLPALGIQTIDLERLANHRGSALGAAGQQPSQKAFESGLAERVGELDPTRPVVIEAESSRIGQVFLPPQLFAAMKAARRVEIKAPKASRAEYLVRVYSNEVAEYEDFATRLNELIRLQGKAQVAAWQTALRDGFFTQVASELIEKHYDPSYSKSRARNGGKVLATCNVEQLDEAGLDLLASKVAEIVNAQQ
ncbi:MAG: tRNA 2-selenouridine(34) synthase MnmH [Boseongicola sp.]